MKKRNGKQIAAIAAIVLLVALSIATLLAAIFDKSGRLFQAFLVATVATPILLWIYIWMYGKLTGKHTMASLDYNIAGGEEADTTEDGIEEEND
jgi:putative effector of murein hydrolase